jgi:putative ATPase
MKRIGYGSGYRYVHSDRRAREEMSCLPDALGDRVYYTEEPTDGGGDEQSDEHC